jgi:hypothetical protein
VSVGGLLALERLASRRALIVLALTLGAGATTCATTLAAASRAARPAGIACQRKPGRTVLGRGAIRIFRQSRDVYGCLTGKTRRVLLWVELPEQQISVAGTAGHDVAVQSVVSNQYTYERSIDVVNLANGTGYSIAGLSWPIDGTPTASPATPGPWPLEAFALGPTGLSARLYATFAAGSSPAAQPSGQVLDVIGPHGYDRTLATTAAGAIAPSSLAYHGHTVSWVQNGVTQSADAAPAGGAGAGTQIVGGTSAQRALLQQIVAAIAPTHVPKLTIVRVRGGVKLEGPQSELGDLSTWAAWTVGAAFLERSITEHLPRVLEVDAGGAGAPASNANGSPLPPPATLSSVTQTEQTMRRLALASGARIDQLTVRAPDALAVILRLQASDAAKFLKHGLRRLVLAAQAGEARYDGLYIEVDDTHGSAWAQGDTLLLGESYVRHALLGCDPFPMPLPLGESYPPCPA